ncbi:lytic murein transglycosylase [Wohlfahrtiimonas chitiniclastica]|uniref:Transglycosylase SLT domain-containing protein n=2 Tax=Wohlfahrtiimonas chitiniclastica TaxID=400946 RepID=A0AB35C3A2_9GAMM|nr:transglycosylase SLT domain-containing protein [Wohlfahrtiimonas chitiniclastica]MBS7815287.1 transglycosylase SLT domain-containing protein [Wohlfahrtiimonas chitiniclastica]MBS7817281.1 transglycosylase SLT domain-containing protein [Wohlfahrtiimonas chitiniclastica]MBS7819157.1 transglycosylase SLT domain-containing protein [Wohlfahrtiimonas chitiniclastica]MBS7823145.1 transglycosylase SLT domain-containing protein [Wohlfahrtiimonas chitiniclastica]MBS7824973.1 transglycosylase SLT doma
MFEFNRKSFKHILSVAVLMWCTVMVNACANPAAKTVSHLKKEQHLIADFAKHRQLSDEVTHKEVQKYVKSFQKDPRIFNHLDEDRLVIMRYIFEELKRRKMPAELAMIPLVESGYQPGASNNGRYVGLWQFGKVTAEHFGIDVHKNYDGRFNPELSTKAALDYLQYLNKMFDGDWLLTIAAYNAGEGRVKRSIQANRQKGKKADYWHIDLPEVTRAYIPKVLALSEVIADRERLAAVSHSEIPNLVRVRVENSEKMKKIIRDSDISMEVIEFYNPNVKHKNSVRSIMIPENELKHLKGLSSKERDQYIVYGSRKQS